MNGKISIGKASEDVFAREKKFGAHNYGPLPVALKKGEGDFLLSDMNSPFPPFKCESRGINTVLTLTGTHVQECLCGTWKETDTTTSSVRTVQSTKDIAIPEL